MAQMSIGSELSDKIKHKELLSWIEESAKLCNPDSIVLIDGSESQKKQLQKEALQTGELIELNQKKWPGCYYSRSAINDVARVEDKTFICTTNKEEAGSLFFGPFSGYRPVHFSPLCAVRS